ncbi:TRAFAC clade GTPase domain-containing protein [Streptomyces sp. MAR4 CNY-716]
MSDIVMFVVIPALYLFALFLYLFIAPFIAALRALALVSELVWRYFRLLNGVLRLRTPEFVTIPPYRPTEELAHRNYFYGPATRDLRQLLTQGRRLYARTIADAFRAVSAAQFTAPTTHRAVSVPYGLTLCAGLGAGAALGAPLLALLLGLHALGVAVLAAGARLTALVLRTADRTVMVLRGLPRGILCRSCYERVPYPQYDCPRTSCRRRHVDIRPGTFGLFRRRCACTERIPTLLMLMSRDARLSGFCVHENCGRPLNPDAGHMPELVLPLIGGRAAGKTQLMAAMVKAMQNAAENGGPAVRLADQESSDTQQLLNEILEIQGHTRPTGKALPQGHSLVRGTGRGERLIHLFDTAGERFVNREETDALRYVRAAGTFVLVLDPMAVDAFWTRLDPTGPQVDRTLASTVDPEDVFSRSVQSIRTMGTRLDKARLAVAVSKKDLLTGRPALLPDRPDDSDTIRDWLCGQLGVRNLVKTMELEFGEVRFFCTAAVADEAGRVDPSVPVLVDWCLSE